MDDTYENGKDIFTQDGVLLKTASSTHIADLNTTGTLCFVEYLHNTKCIEWRPVDILVDSDMQDQEWAMVNTIGKRTRTLSGTPTVVENQNKARVVRLNINDMKGFKLSRNNQEMAFIENNNTKHSSFFFQHANGDNFLTLLKTKIKTVKSKSDKNMYLVLNDPELEVLDRSFTELDIFRENTGDVVWKFVRNLQTRPYETTLEAFSKLTDIVFYGTDPNHGTRYLDAEVADLLTKSIHAIDEATTTHTSDEYEVIGKVAILPPRPQIHRGNPLSPEQWMGLKDIDGRILEVEGVKQIIFRGGVHPDIRSEVWKYLLGYYEWNDTYSERLQKVKQKTDEYFTMKLQWRSMTPGQEDRFTDFQTRKSLIDKDVNRTDRTHPFYEGDNNPNIYILFEVLMTYVMYDFDLGYVQGMSDLLSPILFLMRNEVDAFWCFVGFMSRVSSNFDMDQAGMKLQLQQLHTLLAFCEPELATYLDGHDSGNMFFCFRWLLVLFKREFSQTDIMHLWEIVWTGLPCANFHLLICVALLDTQKSTLIGNGYGFTEILKHINDLSQHIDLQSSLCKAEGIYHQIVSASHLTDAVRVIIGLEPRKPPRPLSDDSIENAMNGFASNGGSSTNSSAETISVNEHEHENGGAPENAGGGSVDESAYENAVSMSYL